MKKEEKKTFKFTSDEAWIWEQPCYICGEKLSGKYLDREKIKEEHYKICKKAFLIEKMAEAVMYN